MPHEHDHHHGLKRDLERLLGRRRMLGLLAGATVLPLIGCKEGSMSPEGAAGSSGGEAGRSGSSGGGSGSCTVIPQETAGPYPGDGSNGPNALTLSGIVRSDIRSSIGSLSGTAEGVLLNVKLNIVNASDGCAAAAGYAVYAWHCDRDGQYSMYGLPNQNYLRGVQETGDDGSVTFKTIFPGCYSGRMPHIHFEIYPSLTSAVSGSNAVRTSQLALPTDVCNTVYATSGYSASVTNLSRITFESDNVFNDGVDQQLATVSGSVSAGYDATLTVAIAD